MFQKLFGEKKIEINVDSLHSEAKSVKKWKEFINVKENKPKDWKTENICSEQK